MRVRLRRAGMAVVLSALALVGGDHRVDAQAGSFVFRLRLTEAALSTMATLGVEAPLRGRLFLLVSRDESREPREQVGVSGIPFWGLDVERMAARPIELRSGAGGHTPQLRGYPLATMAELPAGRYRVQAFFNVYTRYTRADGFELWLHHDRGEGQDLWRSPGNAYSAPTQVTLDPAKGGSFDLTLDRVVAPLETIPPAGVLDQGNPVDSEHVKFVKIRSERLSRFWGRPMYVGANVLLPRDYGRDASIRYPVIYLQGHFPGRNAPFGFREPGPRPESSSGETRRFTDFWLSDGAPRVVVVTIRDANPFYDTSYSVNSANVGPYGDAITQELMSYLEGHFRLAPARWARVLAGGSTGGWEAMALQVFYPTLFAGAWSWCPDSLDFRHHQVVNVYDDPNAYEAGTEWVRVERPNSRSVDGNVLTTIRQENAFEAAVGPRHRSGGQWAIWEAVFGPTAEDGYPQPLWNPDTGVIDKTVAASWRERFDLSEYIRREWRRLAPLLGGRLHVAVGDADTYYLEQGVYAFEERLRTLDPPTGARFEYGPRKPHCWIGSSPSGSGADLTLEEFVVEAARYMADQAPAGADRRWHSGR